MKSILEIREKLVSEEATGINQQGKLLFWDKNGVISIAEAITRLHNNESIAVPAAGAGNYNGIFRILGFTNIKVIDWSSSAGDWTFGVKDEYGWKIAWQENRYPYHGFAYMINNDIVYNEFADITEDY